MEGSEALGFVCLVLVFTEKAPGESEVVDVKSLHEFKMIGQTE